ncbi:hypothetical protein YC2023_020900 [Brassica napus]
MIDLCSSDEEEDDISSIDEEIDCIPEELDEMEEEESILGLQKPGHVKKNQTQRVLQDLLIITIHIFLFQAFPPSQSHLPSTQQIQCIQRPPPAFYNGICTSNALQGHASFNPHANTSLSSRGLAIINLSLSSP